MEIKEPQLKNYCSLFIALGYPKAISYIVTYILSYIVLYIITAE